MAQAQLPLQPEEPGGRRAARLALWFVFTRAWAGAAMVVGTFYTRGLDRYPYWEGEDAGFRWQQVPVRVLDVWGRWDTMFYRLIAEGGYPPPPPSGEWVYQAAFFPLFPTLMRGLSELLGGAPLFYVGLALSNGLLVLAVVYLDKLLRLDVAPGLAEGAVVALLCYPGSHFLSAVYPESTALFLAVLAFYAARTGRPGLAAVAAGLAVLARPTGWLLTPALAVELMRTADGRLRPTRALAFLAVPVACGLLYLGLQQQVFGDPLYFLHVQAAWKRTPSLPLASLLNFDLSPDHQLFFLVAASLFAVALRRRWLRASEATWVGSLLLLPLLTGSLRSIHRLLLGNFPLYAVAARLAHGRRWLARGAVAVSLAVLAVFSFRWGAGMWPN